MPRKFTDPGESIMDKPVVQFKFIGGAGFIVEGKPAEILVCDPYRKNDNWVMAVTSPVIKINWKEGWFETEIAVYSVAVESSPTFTEELTHFQFKWHNPLKGDLPSYKHPVLLVVRGMYAVGELRRETGSYEDSYTSYDYWMDSDESQDWELELVTAWAKLPPLPQGS